MEKSTENVIEFLNGEKTCTVTFNSRRHISKVKKLYGQKKEEFEYLIENPDGSICAKFPVEWIRIRPGRELTKEQRDALAERMKIARSNRSPES